MANRAKNITKNIPLLLLLTLGLTSPVWAAPGDFHLQLTSPAIDAGVFLPVVPIDLEGSPRPQGLAVDLGAYEAPPDTTPPVVSITAPLSGAQVTRQRVVTITATAQDNVRVTRVEILVNGSRLCSRTAAPYRCRWTVPNTVGTRYELQALAWDAAGNRGVSAIVQVRSR